MTNLHMDVRLRVSALALTLSSFAMAQQDSTASSATATPTTTQKPNNNNNNNNHMNAVGYVNYYFVLTALVLFAGVVAAYVLYRRKRRLGYITQPPARDAALERELNTWFPHRNGRGHRHGRMGEEEYMGQEGLNEQGEAPPPYAHKSQRQDEETGEGGGSAAPAVPLQTLSREQAGLTPPGYEEGGGMSTAGQATASPRAGHS